MQFSPQYNRRRHHLAPIVVIFVNLVSENMAFFISQTSPDASSPSSFSPSLCKCPQKACPSSPAAVEVVESKSPFAVVEKAAPTPSANFKRLKDNIMMNGEEEDGQIANNKWLADEAELDEASFKEFFKFGSDKQAMEIRFSPPKNNKVKNHKKPPTTNTVENIEPNLAPKSNEQMKRSFRVSGEMSAIVNEQQRKQQKVAKNDESFEEGKLNEERCNSMVMRKLMLDNMNEHAGQSKRAINLAAEHHFGGDIDVICSSGHFSYVYTSPLFCEVSNGFVACVAFRQNR